MIRCIVDRSCGVHAVVHELASAVTPETGAQMTHGVSPPLQSVWTRGPPAHSQIHAICHSERVNPYLLTGSEEYRCWLSLRYRIINIFIWIIMIIIQKIALWYFLFSRNIKDFKHYLCMRIPCFNVVKVRIFKSKASTTNTTIKLYKQFTMFSLYLIHYFFYVIHYIIKYVC